VESVVEMTGRGRSPYPMAEVPELRPAGGGGLSVFDSADALDINRARMDHLESLGLPIGGMSVLDVGCGVGHLAQFFVERRCRVVCVDARAANIARLRELYPGLEAHVANVESEPLARLGKFDIVFSYGLLYHLENPVAGLRNMAGVCGGILLLETVVSDYALPAVRLIDEPSETPNQAVGGFGCRPTPSFVALALRRMGFPLVYAPLHPPAHPDFRFEWKNNMDCAREGHLLRCIFVGSRTELSSDRLALLKPHAKPAGRRWWRRG
jgi:SAM-dependent methyltransferase